MNEKSKNFIPTILGNLFKGSVLRTKEKNSMIHVSPYRGNIFFKVSKNGFYKSQKKEKIKLDVNDFLTPVEFNNIIGIGKNFKNIVKKNDITQFKLNPDFFLMNTNAILANYKSTKLPYYYSSVLIEPEIGVVIKKECKNINVKEIHNFIKGYLICNDLSGRDLKKIIKDNTLLRKSSDGFLPVSSALIPHSNEKSFVLNTYINGILSQTFNTDNLILKIEDAISFISKHIKLYENDLICTGSASPKLKVKSGDKVEIKVEGFGSLVTTII